MFFFFLNMSGWLAILIKIIFVQNVPVFEGNLKYFVILYIKISIFFHTILCVEQRITKDIASDIVSIYLRNFSL